MTVVTHRRLHTGSGEDFGPRAEGFITGHTWEGKTLTVGTMEQFLASGGPADWQDKEEVLGSYNLVICSNGVVETVQWDHASGGINPGSSGFNPRAWLYGVADRDEIFNPNYFSLQLCFFVSKAYCDANGWPPYMIDAAARAWLEEEQRTKRQQTWTQHADFQPPPNRFDCGDIATRLIKERYQILKGGDMPTGIEPIVNRRAILSVGATARSQPAFNPQNYDDYRLNVHKTPVTRVALFWCRGTNLTLADGTVFDARTRWLGAYRASEQSIQYYHERDVTQLEALETVEVPSGVSLDSWAALQKQATTALRSIETTAGDAAAAIEAKQP